MDASTINNTTKYQLSGVDIVLLKELQKNPSLSDSNLAKNLGIPEYEVQERLDRLNSEEILVNQRVIKQKKEGQTLFFITINVGFDISNIANINRQLNEIPEVKECYTTSGDYQILCKIITNNYTDFHEFVYNEVVAIKGITKVSVIPCFREEFRK